MGLYENRDPMHLVCLQDLKNHHARFVERKNYPRNGVERDLKIFKHLSQHSIVLLLDPRWERSLGVSPAWKLTTAGEAGAELALGPKK